MNDSDAIAIEKEEDVGEISDAAKIRSRFSFRGKETTKPSLFLIEIAIALVFFE